LAAAQSIKPNDMTFIRSKDEALQDDDFIPISFRRSAVAIPGGSAGKFTAAEESRTPFPGQSRVYHRRGSRELARATSGYPGRKNLLWLSEDFPISVGAQLMDPRFRSTPDLAQARETANLIANAQISVYPLVCWGWRPAVFL